MRTTHIERKSKNKKTVDRTGNPLTAGDVNWFNHFGKNFPTFSLKVKNIYLPCNLTTTASPKETDNLFTQKEQTIIQQYKGVNRTKEGCRTKRMKKKIRLSERSLM